MARFVVSFGLNVTALVPFIMPFSTTYSTALRYQSPAPTSVNVVVPVSAPAARSCSITACADMPPSVILTAPRVSTASDSSDWYSDSLTAFPSHSYE